MSIDTTIPFPELHAAVMETRHNLHSGSDAHDDFSCLLITYQHNAARSDRLDELADVCDRRVARCNSLPLDLVAAYGALANLARWRAAQLRRGRP